jgi:hypothetical protein
MHGNPTSTGPARKQGGDDDAEEEELEEDEEESESEEQEEKKPVARQVCDVGSLPIARVSFTWNTHPSVGSQGAQSVAILAGGAFPVQQDRPPSLPD